MIDGIVRIHESDPPTTITLSPTVPITCPPCSVTVHFVKYFGLKLSHCSVTFTSSEPVQNITVEAIKTPGSFSRVTRIMYSETQPLHSPSFWDNYTPTYTPVCLQLYRWSD